MIRSALALILWLAAGPAAAQDLPASTMSPASPPMTC